MWPYISIDTYTNCFIFFPTNNRFPIFQRYIFLSDLFAFYVIAFLMHKVFLIFFLQFNFFPTLYLCFSKNFFNNIFVRFKKKKILPYSFLFHLTLNNRIPKSFWWFIELLKNFHAILTKILRKIKFTWYHNFLKPCDSEKVNSFVYIFCIISVMPTVAEFL